jgi:hypothetical protein
MQGASSSPLNARPKAAPMLGLQMEADRGLEPMLPKKGDSEAIYHSYAKSR